jgi:hypothetical protein
LLCDLQGRLVKQLGCFQKLNMLEMLFNCLDMVEGFIVIGHQFPTTELLDDDNDVFLVQHKFVISSINKIAIVQKKNKGTIHF